MQLNVPDFRAFFIDIMKFFFYIITKIQAMFFLNFFINLGVIISSLKNINGQNISFSRTWAQSAEGTLSLIDNNQQPVNKQPMLIKTQSNRPNPVPTQPQQPQSSQPQADQSPKKPLITELTDESLTSYLKYFLTINDYKVIDQGRDLIKLLNQESNPSIVEKSMQMVCYFVEHAQAEGKVCGLQFLKEVMELGKVRVFLVIEKKIIGMLIDAIEYRNHVKSLARGSTYFMPEIDKNQKEPRVAELVRLSNTFFRMSHEILYVWGMHYFPSSHFRIVYNKLSRYCMFPKFPGEFKFYREDRVLQIEKKQSIIQVQGYLSKRNSTDVPALSSRSNRSQGSRKTIDMPLSSQRSSTKAHKLKEETKQELTNNRNQKTENPITNQPNINAQKINSVGIAKPVNIPQVQPGSPTKEPVRKNVIQLQIKEEQDIFQSQRNQQSSIIKKPQKIVLKPSKSSQKIPRNFIYRQSSIQDPVDVTNQVEKLGKFKKKEPLEVPLGIIAEVTTEDGSSKMKSNSISRNSRNEAEQGKPEHTGQANFKKKMPLKEEKLRISGKNEENSSPVSSERVGIDIQSSNDSNRQSISSEHVQDQKEPQKQVPVPQNPVSQSKNLQNPKIQPSQPSIDKPIKPIKPAKGNPSTKVSIKQQNFTQENIKQVMNLGRNRSAQKIEVIPITSQKLIEEINQGNTEKIKTGDTRNQAQISVKNDDRIIKIKSNPKREVEIPKINLISHQQQPANTKKQEPQHHTEQNQQPLPIQSDRSSNSSLSKSTKFKSKKFTLHTSTTKKRRKSSLLEDPLPAQILKNPRLPQKLVYQHAFDVKELGQATNIMDKIRSDHKLQVELEVERKIRSQRKLRKFREISVAYVPEVQEQFLRLQSQVENSRNQEIRNLKEELTSKIVQLEQTTNSKANEHLSQIKQLLQKQFQNLTQKTPAAPISIPKKQSQKNPQRTASFFSEDTPNQQSSSISKTKCNTSKRSSLSQIKNREEIDYQKGTMLYYLAQRRSVIL